MECSAFLVAVGSAVYGLTTLCLAVLVLFVLTWPVNDKPNPAAKWYIVFPSVLGVIVLCVSAWKHFGFCQ